MPTEILKSEKWALREQVENLNSLELVLFYMQHKFWKLAGVTVGFDKATWWTDVNDGSFNLVWTKG